MNTIDKIVKVMNNSRDLTSGYQTFSHKDLEDLRALLEEFKKEIKAEVLEEMKK